MPTRTHRQAWRHAITLAAALSLSCLAAPPSAWAQVAASGGASKPGTYPGSNGNAASVGGSASRGSRDTRGFGCQSGTWDYQGGGLACVSSDSVAAVSAFVNKALLIRVPAGGGWISAPVVQVVGSKNDIRVDVLDQQGYITKSCYLTTYGSSCNLGYLTASANRAYTDQLPDGSGVKRYASEFLTYPGLVLGGSPSGPYGGDNYIVSGKLETSGALAVHVVGFFTDQNTYSTSRLAARLATISFSATELNQLAVGTTTRDANSTAANTGQ